MSNILITGGAGFIGRATTTRLLELGHRVTWLDSLQRRVHPHGAPPVPDGVKLHVGDVRSHDILGQLLPAHDAVLHLAAYQDYQPDYSTFFDVNVSSTALLYELANQLGWSGTVVVASSQATLGEGVCLCDVCELRFRPSPRPAGLMETRNWEHLCLRCGRDARPGWTHEDEWQPVTPYGVSKQAEEQVALTLGTMLDIPSVALRYSIVQGVGQSPWNAYSGVMRATCLQILAGGDVVVFEDGGQQRDFVPIDDVVEANVLALRGAVPSGGYNVGGERSWTVMELARKMLEIAGQDPERVTAPGLYRVGDVRHTLSDCSKLTSVTTWRPHGYYIDETTWPAYWNWLASLDLDAESIVGGAFDRMKKTGVLREVVA